MQHQFCCQGCEIVWDILKNNSFEKYQKENSIDPKFPIELYPLRPDRISIIKNTKGPLPSVYRYSIDNEFVDFPVNQINGYSNILHIKQFNPLDDFSGLSPLEAAAYSINQHNYASRWNESLLKNGARPSGALVVENNNFKNLSQDEFDRLKSQLNDEFAGVKNAGKPLLLEGGLKWQEISMTNKDMDFIEAKHSAAREIALAFGVPPQLLGIPGDNTYSNLQEARIALWEESIIPILENIKNAFARMFSYYFKDVKLDYDQEQISSLTGKRAQLWNRIETASFLTINEKRQILGFEPINGLDVIKDIIK